MQIIRETIVIPDEKQINTPIFKKELEVYEPHGLGIVEFSSEYNLNQYYEKFGLTDDNYYDLNWFIRTVQLGHLVIQKDEDIIVYLPPVITEQQYSYLLERKNEFSKYGKNLYAYSLCYDDGIFFESGINTLMKQTETNKIELLYQEVRKKYIPNTDSFVLVIPNESDFIIENGIYFQEFDTNIGHANMLQVFCMLNLISITSLGITGEDWGRPLAKNGFFVVTREKERIYLFIPKTLSFNQKNWLMNNKKMLYNFEELEALIYQEDGSYREIFKAEQHPIYKTVTELIDEIYEEINYKQKIMKRG